MERDGRRLTHVNGRRVEPVTPVLARHPNRSIGNRPTEPRCPKHCDTATPPEHGGGDQYVCVCCGTQFTWKGSPP